MNDSRFWLAAVCVLSCTAQAQEGPPLETWIEAALKNNTARTRAQGALLAAEAQSLERGTSLLPTLTARGSYTRNQYETVIELPNDAGGFDRLVVQPRDSVEGSLNVTVPLIDPPGLARWLAARKAKHAASADDRASENDVALLVAQRYYQAAGAAQVVRAVERALAVATENARIVHVRVREGAAMAVEADRAVFEVARQEQLHIDAKRSWAVAARALASATGLPEPKSLVAPPPSMEPAPPEQGLLEVAVKNRPELAAAKLRSEQANLGRTSAWLSYAPTLSANGRQVWSNIPGFVGEPTYWTLGLQAEWRILDFGLRSAQLKAERGNQLQADAQLRQREIDVRDEVRASWLDVESARAKLTAARRGEEVARRASDAVRARYKAGTASQLDVIQSDRDSLQAEVDRIRAEGELSTARLVLRHATSEGLVSSGR